RAQDMRRQVRLQVAGNRIARVAERRTRQRAGRTPIWTSSSLHSLGADADSLVRRVGENLTEQVLFRNRKDERGNQLPDPHAPELGFHCKLPDHLLVEGQSS